MINIEMIAAEARRTAINLLIHEMIDKGEDVSDTALYRDYLTQLGVAMAAGMNEMLR
jgi:hypothetical protein